MVSRETADIDLAAAIGPKLWLIFYMQSFYQAVMRQLAALFHVKQKTVLSLRKGALMETVGKPAVIFSRIQEQTE